MRPPQPGRPHVKITIRTDGTVRHEVAGVPGSACAKLTEAYRASLCRDVQLMPTGEFYETPDVETETETETQEN